MSLIYYFDLGNTRGKFWCCRNDAVEARAEIVHEGDMRGLLSKLPIDDFRLEPDAILGASVLTDVDVACFSDECKHRWGRLPILASSQSMYAGVRSAYEIEPHSLGIDRWLALIALRREARDICVLDCGTAITLDVLGADGLHWGGYILPGLSMMSESLRRETKRVRFAPDLISQGIGLGRTTADAVLHGSLAAVVALVERVCRQGRLTLVLTGGDAHRLSAVLDYEHRIEPELLLQGLQRYFADADIKNLQAPLAR